MSLTNPSRLLAKYADRFQSQQLVLLNPDGDSLIEALAPQVAHLTLLNTDWVNHQRLLPLQRGNVSLAFGADIQALDAPSADAVVIRIPKAREQLRYLLAMASALLPAEAPVYLVGENKGGIRSAAKSAEPWLDGTRKLASGAHCQLLMGSNRAQQPWQPETWWLQHQVATPDGELALASLPGVFGHGSLDPGTELLLQQLPSQPQGRVLDFGCGDGVIGAFLAQRNPAIELEMVDINAMALAASAQSLTALGHSAKVYPSDGLSQVQGQFDLIVSNPPFHHGLDQTFDTARRFIRQAVEHLKPGGQLIFVANGHLPYGDDLDHAFGRVNIIAQDSKFKIYADKK
ncbi:class I SAM-dependent methyltransferase [Ferrimonas marina]|uniref:Ribosomal RNA small subunit methyltransferase C n=1 Tax=Ferrimonas marina TaxID=299255 RepID=A0A1M5VVI9_9GAMM|nr:class I SAM-dependent methyltransferase [Ferrimonas marina]SHH79256.1 16S rRNA (guanine1207-N2)-methyltransferase [Ferrimonas marina]